MLNKRLFPLALIIAPACALPGDAAWSGAHLNAFGGMIQMENSGAMNNLVVGAGGAGDLEGDVDMGTSKDSVFYGGGRIGFAPLELVFSTFSVDSETLSSMSGTSFNGVPLGGLSMDATTDLSMNIQKAMLGLDLFNSGVFRIGILLGVDQLSFNEWGVTSHGFDDGAGNTIGAGIREPIVSNEDVLVPMAGLRLDAEIPFGIRAGVEYTGIDLDVEDIDVSYFDFDANLNYAFTDQIELIVGYRSIDFSLNGELDATTLDAELGFTGPYAALGIAF